MENSAVKTIDRLVKVLDQLAREQQAISLAELSTNLEVPKSTLHRFLVSLEMHGLVRRSDADKKWQLGYHLLAWGRAAAGNTSLRDIARPFMCELVETTGETALLTVLHDHEVMTLDMCETSHPVRLMMQIGAQRPAHAGASSKVLLAYQPEGEINAIIAEKGLERLCSNTITDVGALKTELKRIRQRGYADSLEETDPGAWGVATPIFGLDGQVVGAIGLAGPTLRYSEEKVVQYALVCREKAARITEHINPGIPPASNS